MSQTATQDPRMTQLRAHLLRGGQFGYYWTASEAKNDKNQALEQLTHWHGADSVPPLPRDTGRCGVRHIYFGVHPTTARGTPYQRAKKGERDIAAINCLFTEIDAKDFDGSVERLSAHVAAFDPAPSVLISSSRRGYHCYWFLTEPFILDTPEKREWADRVQKAWVARMGGDDGAKDLSRVLRVPGTRNYKAAYGPDYPMVHFERADFELLYTIDTLAALVPVQPATPKQPRTPAASAETPAATVDDTADFATIAEVAALFDRLSPDRRDSYTGWYEVGMAVRSMGHIGLYLWKTWSETSPKYRPGDCDEKWPTFKPGAPGSRLVNLDSLRRWAREDDPDGTTVAGDVVPRADYEKVKAERDDLLKQSILQQKIMYRQDIKPQEKGILAGLVPIVEAARHRGDNHDRVPLSYGQVADVLNISKSTIGRVIDVAETIGFWRKDPEIAIKDGIEVKHMRLELQGWDTIETLPEVVRAKHGGERPGAGRKPRCPKCSPDTAVVMRTVKKIEYTCLGCGEILHTEIIPLGTVVLTDEIQDETGEGAEVAGNQDETGTAVPSVFASEPGNQDETGDTTSTMAPNSDGVARTRDQLQTYVNPDQVRYVLTGLKLKGTDWARQHMASVAPWEKWPAKVHHAIHMAEGLSSPIVEPPIHGVRGTAVRA